MSKEITVSFVVPVYKKEPQVFRDCLRSLYDQSLKNIEIICVFDGPDETLQAVASEFPKAKQLVIEHGGAPKARNAGLELATGKYVYFWDADCYIKPDSAKRAVEEFEAVPDADFVYSGYEVVNEGGTLDSEPFDRYSLECGNYICTMSPIKREKAHKWDETLTAAQDWDYWLTAVERGLKGVYVEGHAFITEAANRTSISANGLQGPRHDEIVKEIRYRHGIPERSIGIYSTSYRAMGLKLAQILGADFIKPQGFNPTKYKTIFNFGYGYASRFEGIAEDVTKIQYWLPGEIEMLQTRSYTVVKETIRVAKGVTNLCNTQYEKNKLLEYGIEATVVPLPLAQEDYDKISKELPKEFSILVATDDAYAKLLKELAVDLPHIKFLYNAAKVSDFSCFLSFYQFAALDNAMLVALVNGRHVISNVQAPHSGFIDPDQIWEKFKGDLYEKIREVRKKPLNAEAQNYYLELADPETFKRTIESYSKVPMEVLA